MICVYSPTETDFTTLGMGAIHPTECTISETAGGEFTLTLSHPVDDTLTWTYLQNGAIIKAPCAAREAPLLTATDGSGSKTVTRAVYKVKTHSGSRLRLRAKATTSSSALGSYKPETEVVVVSTSGDWSQVIVTTDGASGWMHSDYLTFVRNQTENVKDGVENTEGLIKTGETRDQLFRIYSVEKDVENQQVTVTANHIFYDLMGIICNIEYSPESVNADTALNKILSNLSADHNFTFHNTVTTAITGEYTGLSLVNILLDPDIGIVSQTGARIIRDNFDVYILPDATSDRGFEIRHQKNMTGATMTTDASNVVTRIKPIGKDKDGNRLTLTENKGFVVSDNIDNYPTPRDTEVEYDVSVGDGDKQFSTNAKARAELKKLAQADFKAGADAPEVSLNVSFVLLQNTSKYANYSQLLHAFLYDTVHVIAKFIDIDAKLRINSYTYNALTRVYDDVQLGDMTDITQTVYGYDIASGSVSGNRLIQGTVDGSTLKNATINYAKISVAAIEQLTATAITAIRATISEIVSKQITTDQLYADLATIAVAQLTTANIQNANIDWASISTLTAQIATLVEADIKTATITSAQISDLNAAVAEIADARIEQATISTAQIENLTAEIVKALHAEIEVGSFTLAEVKNLLANALILQQGIADSMMITNLAVTSANLLNATIGELVLKGTDGKYYRVIVGSDGTIQTEQTTVTDSEISAGETTDGHAIVSTSANIADLSAQTVKASQAVINTIMTESLTAGKITAGEALIASATIPALYTTSIEAIGNSLTFSANEKIQSIVGELDETTLIAQDASDSASNALALAEETQEGLTTVEAAAKAAQEAANTNAAGLKNLQTTVTQTQEGLSVVRTEQTNLEGRVTTIESGVHIEGAEIGIYASDSPFQNIITNTGWTITENDTPVITCAETKLSAPRVQINDALMIGDLAIRPGSDKHVRVLKYGK